MSVSLPKICKSMFLTSSQLGFSGVLDEPHLVNHLVLCLRTPSLKLRIQIMDLLSALCVLSVDEGPPLILNAFSEAAQSLEEAYRFEWLVRTLISTPGEDEAGGIWDWRIASLGLFIALTRAFEDLEERCDVRGELTRRGLMHVLEVSFFWPCSSPYCKLIARHSKLAIARELFLISLMTTLENLNKISINCGV